MRQLSYRDALNEALDEAMAADERVYLIGEDIGIYGGGFGVTQGLQAKYGKKRVRDTPISESALTGVAVGSAMTGLRPIVELQFSDFITIAMDQLVNQAAKVHYMSGGQLKVPLVLRTAGGSGTGAGSQHSQSLENWLAHIPGLKVVQPATAYDAKGLLHAAIADDNPVIIYEHKLCYQEMSQVPESYYEIPLGVADIKREGTDVTLIATSIMVYKALEAAEQVANDISVEVIDPRTLVPLDIETLLASVAKTRRVIVVTESVKRGGFGGEIVAQIAESDVARTLKQPIRRLGGEAVPMPVAAELEQLAIPQVTTIVEALYQMSQGGEDEHEVN